jgi:dipeptidyl aminopeptidase/acylaminoacyl peptidase
MDADGAHALQLTHNGVAEGSTALSPDGAQVLFVAQANDQFDTYYNRNLFLVPAAGGRSTLPVPDLPYDVEDADWSADGHAILFTANMGVHSELFQLDLASHKLTQLTDGQHAIGSWSYDAKSGRHVMRFDEPADPGEAWIFSASGAPQRVTHVYDDLGRRFKLPRQEKITWKGADGVTVEGLLSYPTDYRAGTWYPLVVQTHGGPQASDKFGFGEGTTSYTPVLTAKGYAVLKPNYRGSTGYGNAFLRDMVGHYFKNAHLDVLAGVDQVIKMGVADSARMAKMGWSGGGHMTNKIITFTNRFKAAASGAGAANWISMYAQSDTRTYRTPWFGGTPWQANAPIDVYWENSPLKYVSNVKTPTIFFVGEEDPRVPKPQSVEMYRALKSNGVPTHLYVAPREPHGWGELRHQLFKMNVELAWFEKYVTGREYTWERAPGDDKPAANGGSK